MKRNAAVLLSLLIAITAAAETQLVLERGTQIENAEYTGVVRLTINPGFENAKVNVTVDGQKVATNLLAPYRLDVDFGPTPVQHRIAVTAISPKGRRTQWTET